jgi:hypothetical protein
MSSLGAPRFSDCSQEHRRIGVSQAERRLQSRVARSRDHPIGTACQDASFAFNATPWRGHSHRKCSDCGRALSTDLLYMATTTATTTGSAIFPHATASNTARSPRHHQWRVRRSKRLQHGPLTLRRSEVRMQKEIVMQSPMRPREVSVHTS